MTADVKGHTPLPWQVFDGGGEIGNCGTLSIISTDKRKNEVVAWGGFDASNYPQQARANAALIVHSVNTLPAVVKALESSKAQHEKIAAWLETIADNHEREAEKVGQFLSLKEAYLADAKNYRATVAHVRKEIQNIEATLATVKP